MVEDNREIKLDRHFTTKTSWREWITAYGATSTGFLQGANQQLLSSVDGRVKLLMDDSFTFTAKNHLSSPFEGIISKLTSGAGMAAGVATGAIAAGSMLDSSGLLPQVGQSNMADAARGLANIGKINPAVRYVKAWDRTDPISFTLKFDFEIGKFGLWNALEEVVKPIVSLLLPALPRNLTGLTMMGPYQSSAQLFGTLVGQLINSVTRPGQTGADRFGSLLNTINRILSGDFDSQGNRVNNTGTWGLTDVTIGTVAFIPRCYYKDVSATLHPSKVDENGYSVEGSVSIGLESLYPPASLTHIRADLNSRFGRI